MGLSFTKIENYQNYQNLTERHIFDINYKETVKEIWWAETMRPQETEYILSRSIYCSQVHQGE